MYLACIDELNTHAALSPTLETLQHTREGRNTTEQGGHPRVVLVALGVDVTFPVGILCAPEKPQG